ncbi:F-box protein [Candidatus Dependentiae bacterium]
MKTIQKTHDFRKKNPSKIKKLLMIALCISGPLVCTSSSNAFFLLTQLCVPKFKKTVTKTKFNQISLFKQSKTLNNLPKEILYQIYSFSNSDYRNLLSLSRVSKHTYKSLLYFLKNQKKLKIKIQGKPSKLMCRCFDQDIFRCSCDYGLLDTIAEQKNISKNLKILIHILRNKTLCGWIKNANKSLAVNFKIDYKKITLESTNKNELKKLLSNLEEELINYKDYIKLNKGLIKGSKIKSLKKNALFVYNILGLSFVASFYLWASYRLFYLADNPKTNISEK